MGVLSLIPRYGSIDLEEAEELVADPLMPATTYPFGKPMTCPGTSTPKPVAPEEPPKGTKMRHSAKARKFGTGRIPETLRDAILENLPLTTDMHKIFWKNLYLKMSSGALAAGTWKSYTSALNLYDQFCKIFKPVEKWPLSGEVAASFILWTAEKRSLAAATVKHYITALKTFGVLMGFPRQCQKWDTVKMLLKGFENLKVGTSKGRKRPDPLTYAVLKSVHAELCKKRWKTGTKKTIWACCCVGYFGSFRISELLTSSQKIFDRFTDLTWADISKVGKNCVAFHVKSPKTGVPGGEWVPVFSFPEKNFCPIKSLWSLKRCQKKNGIWEENLPVFRFTSGKALTAKVLNNAIKVLLKRTRFHNMNITGRSLRAGIPTDLESHPELANDKHVKIWGRWLSTAYKRYMKGGCAPKKWVFDKICAALLK